MTSDDKRPSPAGEEPQEIPGESPGPQEDFASMLEESFQSGPPQILSFEIGQSVEGVIVAMGQDAAFVDIGGKGEATISLEELRDQEGELYLLTSRNIGPTGSTGQVLKMVPAD